MLLDRYRKAGNFNRPWVLAVSYGGAALNGAAQLVTQVATPMFVQGSLQLLPWALLAMAAPLLLAAGMLQRLSRRCAASR